MPEAKPRQRLVIKTESLEVLAGIRPFRPPQTFLKKPGRAHMRVEQSRANLSVASLRWTGKADLRHRHAQLLSQQPDGLGESNVLHLLNKSKDIPRLSAPKAVKKLPRGMHRKRSPLPRMKHPNTRQVLHPTLLHR